MRRVVKRKGRKRRKGRVCRGGDDADDTMGEVVCSMRVRQQEELQPDTLL